mmetsp:Transcript_22212/g.49409  ORF Transcript_22212/g.49409 Transcript_22212/m.49409 type:complete len:244 (-) Transcript_22212:739-1470(-)
MKLVKPLTNPRMPRRVTVTPPSSTARCPGTSLSGANAYRVPITCAFARSTSPREPCAQSSSRMQTLGGSTATPRMPTTLGCLTRESSCASAAMRRMTSRVRSSVKMSLMAQGLRRYLPRYTRENEPDPSCLVLSSDMYAKFSSFTAPPPALEAELLLPASRLSGLLSTRSPVMCVLEPLRWASVAAATALSVPIVSMDCARDCADFKLRSMPCRGERISSASSTRLPCRMSRPCHQRLSASSV